MPVSLTLCSFVHVCCSILCWILIGAFWRSGFLCSAFSYSVLPTWATFTFPNCLFHLPNSYLPVFTWVLQLESSLNAGSWGDDMIHFVACSQGSLSFVVNYCIMCVCVCVCVHVHITSISLSLYLSIILDDKQIQSLLLQLRSRCLPTLKYISTNFQLNGSYQFSIIFLLK